MGFDVHTIDIPDGATPLAQPDRLKVGMLTNVAVPGANGEMVAGVVDVVGGGYTSIPTGTASGGTGGTITPSMALETTALISAGTAYAPGDLNTLTGGTASQQGIIEVLTTKLVAAPVLDSAGTSYAVNDNITLQGGAVVSVATVSSGSQIATIGLVSGGVFTSNITGSGGLTQQSTTGSGSGATFSAALAKYGINAIEIENGGSYSALPTSPIGQGSTTGGGSGMTVSGVAWQLESVSATGGTGYADGAAITFSGGSGSGAEAHVTTEQIGDLVTIPCSFTSTTVLPAVYNVQVSPNGPCFATVTEKTQSGFNVNLSPPSSSQAIGATAVDILVTA